MKTEQSKIKYKFFVSLAFGLAGFCINFYPLDVVIPPHKASFVWGLLFPMLISLSWGWKYGLLAATLGLGGQTMWFLWLPLNGWAPFVSIILYNLWIVWHGWCAEKKKKGILPSFYGAEIPFRIFSTIMHLTVFPWVFMFNPSPWAPQMTMTSAPSAFVHFIVFKQVIEGLMVLFLADILMNFSVFQKLLLLEERKQTRTAHIISASLLLGLIFWIISGLAGYLFFAEKVKYLLAIPNPTLADTLILQVPPHELFTRLIFIFTCLIAGLVVAKYMSRYKESEERYKTFFNNNHLIMLIVDPKTAEIFDANPAACHFYGYSKQEITAKKVSDINLLSHDQILQEMERAKAEQRQHFFFQHRLANGEIRDVEVYTGPITLHGKNFLYSVVHDITERKKIENALKGSEERFRKLFEQASDAFFVHDLNNGTIINANRSACNSLGYTLEEIKQLHVSDIEVSFPSEKIIEICTKVAKGEHVITEGIHRRKDSSTFPVEISLGLFQEMKPELLLAIVRDISDKKLAETELAAEKERLAVTLRSIGDGVITTDISGNIVLLNKVAENLTGWRNEEAAGRSLEEVFHIINEQTREICENPVAKVISSGQIVGLSNHTVLVARDGRERRIADSGAPILDVESNIIGVVLVFRDVTDQIKTENQLHRGQKMEAIGMMAGGVAHDLNNILSGIISYPELLLLDLPKDSPLRQPIETIQSSGLRAAAVVADLLTVARGTAAAKEVCNLNTLLQDSLESPELKRPLESQPGITFHTDFALDLFTFNCSSIHIRKCLLNLFMNACEAVDKVGMVTISTSNRYIDKPLKGYDEVRRGEYVVLSVADTGSGISSVDIDHIFEPFYSKKVMGRSGTGLGLAVVWSAVQDHNGYIDITTDDQGTCFDLYFPASRELVHEGKEQITSQDLQGKGQTVLVVDDEATQRDIATTLLTRLGYQPTSVSSGEEAVSYLKTHTVDLLVLDMIMDPGMNGRQTYEQIISLHPGQKAIIASGFSETDEVKKAQNLGAGIFIKKPYTINQLGYAVKQQLEA